MKSNENKEAYADCLTEQMFKTRWCTLHHKDYKALWTIETEETVAGFPDVLGIMHDDKAVLLEFKKSLKGYSVQFQPTQIAFFRRNRLVPIYVVALVAGEVHVVTANEVLDDGKLTDGCSYNFGKEAKF